MASFDFMVIGVGSADCADAPVMPNVISMRIGFRAGQIVSKDIKLIEYKEIAE